MMIELIGVTVLVALFGLSFFCSLTETAIFTLNGPLIAKIKEQKSRRVPVVLSFLESSQATLTSLTFLNTFANFAIAGLSLSMVLHRQFEHTWVIFLVLVILIVGCEICPKTLAMRHPEIWSLRVVPFLTVLTPLIKLLSHFSREEDSESQEVSSSIPNENALPSSKLTTDEYKELLELACQQGTMSVSEKDFIIQIISLDSRTAKESMKLRSQMAYLPGDASVEEMLVAARKYKHRRLPLYNEATRDITGVINTKKLLLQPNVKTVPDEILDVPPNVPDSMNLLELLKSFQRVDPGLVVVLDEFGEISGIITMEDILEEVVGNIRSESEETGFILEQESKTEWRVSGSLLLEDLNRVCPEMKVPEHIQTVGGLMLNILETVPLVDQSVLYCGYRFTALVVEFARIREVHVSKVSPKAKTRNPSLPQPA